MAVQTYTPASGEVMRVCRVDFSSGEVPSPVILMQYDSDLIILAVQLYNNNVPFVLQAGDDANVKLIKPDGTVVYNPVLGCNENRDMVYVQVTYQMTIIAAELTPMIEIVRPNVGVVTSSYINMRVMRNPTPIGGLISENEIQILTNTLNDAVVAAEQAVGAATRVEEIYGRYQDVEAAGEYADIAEESAESARAYAEQASAWLDVSNTVLQDFSFDDQTGNVDYSLNFTANPFDWNREYLYMVSICANETLLGNSDVEIASTLLYVKPRLQGAVKDKVGGQDTYESITIIHDVNVVSGDQTFTPSILDTRNIVVASQYHVPITLDGGASYPNINVKVLRQRIGMTSVN